MKTSNDIKQDKIINLLCEITAFIRSHDASYERELEQANEIRIKLDNLIRYANALQDRLL
jgi:hypothetical protein